VPPLRLLLLGGLTMIRFLAPPATAQLPGGIVLKNQFKFTENRFSRFSKGNTARGGNYSGGGVTVNCNFVFIVAKSMIMTIMKRPKKCVLSDPKITPVPVRLPFILMASNLSFCFNGKQLILLF
jgi:hypothetical protein